jgi:2-polyprenyl-3-methyl-5-hydroxy-6-metoxy-1,4-benzoquinol methylase
MRDTPHPMSSSSVSVTQATPKYAASFLTGDVNDPRVQGLGWVRPGSRVLEIGCGHGAVTRVLVDRLGCSVVAVDTNPECATDVRDTGARFVCGDIDSPHVREQIQGPYDYILLMDVLEHLPWPARTLSTLMKSVGTQAQAVITLPNVTVWHVRLPLLRGEFTYQDTGTLDRTHLRFFDLDGARQLVSDAGLQLREMRFSWNIPWLGVAWSYSRLAEDPQTEPKALRRFPQHARAISLALRAHRKVNALGWPALLDRTARAIHSSAPRLWTNHVIMLAQLAT